MMKFNVLFFASLRELFGVQSAEIKIPKSLNSLNDLVEFMGEHEKGPWLELSKNKKLYKVAINQELCDWDHKVSDGDELAFFPPITGG